MEDLRIIPLVVSLLCGVADAQPADQPANARLLAAVSAVKPGEPFVVGIMLKMEPGWHVYWVNPGDSGQPPVVKWALPNGFAVTDLEFPVPTRLNEPGGLVAYGYHDEVLLTARVLPPADLKVGSKIQFRADVSWLVCEKICLPGEAKLSIELPVAESATPANTALFQRWQVRLPQDENDIGAAVSVTKMWDTRELEIRVGWKGNSPPSALDWFPPASGSVNFSEIRTSSSGRQTRIMCKFSPLAGKSLPDVTMLSVLAYHAHDGSRKGLLIPLNLRTNENDVPLPSE